MGLMRCGCFLLCALCLLGPPGVSADHPCSDEVASACPETPASDIASCLKDPEQHSSPTELSSECTDFMALNKACKDEIAKLCDEAFFSDDTILCLTQWHQPDELGEKCQKVIKWAVPKSDDEGEDGEGEGPTDELGMTEKEKEEKEEWRAKRKENREAAMERIKMKEVDRKKEEDRAALEKFKTEDPEGYANMIAQQEEEKRQQAEFKRRERMQAAAIARKKAAERGEDEDEAPEVQKKKASKKKSGSSWNWILGLLFLGVIGVLGYFLVSGASGGGGKGKAAKKGKKRG